MLFAHFGLSGPAPLDVSRAVSGHPAPATLTLEVDLLPGESEAQFDEFVRVETAASGKQLLAGVLSAKLTRRVVDQLLVLCGLPVDRRAAALAKPDRQRLVAAVKRLRIPLTGTLGFEKAEVTAGGVSLDEVDSRTMQSKLRSGSLLRGRSARPRRLDRRLQLPVGLEHRLARGPGNLKPRYYFFVYKHLLSPLAATFSNCLRIPSFS